MNRLLIFALLCLPVFSYAQYPTFFDRLEGKWQNPKQPSQYAEWQYVDAQTFAYRLFEVSGTDTLVSTMGKVNCKQLELSIHHGVPVAMTLEYDKTNCDLMRWKNAATTLSWAVFAHEVTITENDVVTSFKYKRERGPAMHPVVGLRILGAMGTTFGHVNRGAPSFNSDRPTADFTPGQAAMAAVALSLGFKESPMAFQVELGMSKRTIGGVINSTSGHLQFSQNGTYDIRSVYIGLVPTLSFGRNKQWAGQAGIFFKHHGTQEFTGTVSLAEPAFLPTNSAAQISSEGGGLLGLIYRPLAARRSILQPECFVRYTSPFGGLYKAHSVMAGVSFRLGR